MQNQRKHKRFKLRLVPIESKLSQVGKADIVDMSLGGVLLRAEGKLTIRRECTIQFTFHGRTFPVKGTVVRSELSGIDAHAGGAHANLYLIGVMFKEESEGAVKDLLGSIEQSKKVEVPAVANWRFRDIHFNVTTPSEKVLDFPDKFAILDISRSGIIIRTGEPLKPESMILLELSLGAAQPASFMGRIVTCRRTAGEGAKGYTAGVEFTDLTDQAYAVLLEFMESLKDGGA